MSRPEAQQVHMAYRIAQKIASGLMGYRTPKLNGVAVLQHYGWPRPLLEFSATLEVAIFFALFDARPDQPCVIYHLDLGAVPENLIVFQERELELLPWLATGATNSPATSTSSSRWSARTAICVNLTDMHESMNTSRSGRGSFASRLETCFRLG